MTCTNRIWLPTNTEVFDLYAFGSSKAFIWKNECVVLVPSLHREFTDSLIKLCVGHVLCLKRLIMFVSSELFHLLRLTSVLVPSLHRFF